MNLLEILINILKEEHKAEINLKDEVYYIFFNDGMFLIYFDEDEKTIKTEIEMLPEDRTFVYRSNQSLEEIVKQAKNLI